ncbi:hypothetical protein C5705_27930, partial [Klebsiella pneumoniae]
TISSTHGRGILADSHRASLRAFHNSPSVEALISQCDFTLVAGSRLRRQRNAARRTISSTHGRGILADSHRASLRAFHNSPSVEALI